MAINTIHWVLEERILLLLSRETLNIFVAALHCSLPDLGEPLDQLRVAAARGAELPQLLQRRADQLLALPLIVHNYTHQKTSKEGR